MPRLTNQQLINALECQLDPTHSEVECKDCPFGSLEPGHCKEATLKAATKRLTIKENHDAACRTRWHRLRNEHRCTRCGVQLPDGYKFVNCLACRLENAEAKRRGRMVK